MYFIIHSTAFIVDTDTSIFFSILIYTGDEPYLLFANRRMIQRINLNGSKQETVWNVTAGNIVGLDYDYR